MSRLIRKHSDAHNMIFVHTKNKSYACIYVCKRKRQIIYYHAILPYLKTYKQYLKENRLELNKIIHKIMNKI